MDVSGRGRVRGEVCIGRADSRTGPVGASANYWMTSDVAALFRKARDIE